MSQTSDEIPPRIARPIEHQRPTVEVDGVPLSEGFPITKIVLDVVDGQDRGRRFVSEQSSVRLGADPLCDVVLTDPTVSRNHAEVRARGAGFMLIDLQSTNGTFVDDERVESAPLEAKSTFRLGRSELRFDVLTEKVSVSTTSSRTRYDNIIGTSRALREIFSILDRVAPSELSVIIEGETGAGKELIARAIHDHSNRAKGPFVVFDCSAFPPSLLESELFGHEKGAFTGAVGRHVGVFERADKGTLFFDELGELDLEFQAKFLRVLETGKLRRVGGERTIEVDVRMVSATNRNVKEMVEEKTFRSDLFYRLAQVRFLLPALRQRTEDIPMLVEHFLEQQAERTGRKPMMELDAIKVLQSYSWPGNIRELRNAIEKAVALSSEGLITADYFQKEFTQERPTRHHAAPAASLSQPSHPESVGLAERSFISAPSRGDGLRAEVSEVMAGPDGELLPFKEIKEVVVSSFERQYLNALLARTGNNISKASRKAGIDRRHFYRLLKKLDIEVD